MSKQRFGFDLGMSKLLKGLALLAFAKTALLVMLGVGEVVIDQQNAPGSQAAEVKSSIRGAFAPQVAHAQETGSVDPKDNATVAEQNENLPAGPMDIKALQKRRLELDRREARLNQLEKDIEAKLAKLQNLENGLSKMLKEADSMKNKKLRHLVEVYANMKSKQAAEVLETLNQEIAVKILSGMRGRQAGEILTYVRPEKAAMLSEALTKLQTPFE